MNKPETAADLHAKASQREDLINRHHIQDAIQALEDVLYTGDLEQLACALESVKTVCSRMGMED